MYVINEYGIMVLDDKLAECVAEFGNKKLRNMLIKHPSWLVRAIVSANGTPEQRQILMNDSSEQVRSIAYLHNGLSKLVDKNGH